MTETQIVMAGTVVLLIIYDCYAAIQGGLENTISWNMYSLSKKYPIIPFAMGALCAHFFFNVDGS